MTPERMAEIDRQEAERAKQELKLKAYRQLTSGENKMSVNAAARVTRLNPERLNAINKLLEAEWPESDIATALEIERYEVATDKYPGWSRIWVKPTPE